MKRAIVAIIILACGCARDTNKESAATANADTSQIDTAQSAGVTANDSASKQSGTRFDPKTTRAGDRIAGLQVVKADVHQNADTALNAWSGSVQFKGQTTLAGSYRAHFDYPQVKEACFWVDPSEWKKLPRMQGDSRVVWFCFSNKDEAIQQLGALGTETRATVVIDDYTTNVQRSDVYDTVRLVRVVEKHKI